MELYVCNNDGSELRQITNLGGSNWPRLYHLLGDKTLFSPNRANEAGLLFNLYMINEGGTEEAKQMTYDGTFDSLPMFNFDGKKLFFCSNRNKNGGSDTNTFIADWVD